jgi:hypothetical protein
MRLHWLLLASVAQAAVLPGHAKRDPPAAPTTAVAPTTAAASSQPFSKDQTELESLVQSITSGWGALTSLASTAGTVMTTTPGAAGSSLASLVDNLKGFTDFLSSLTTGAIAFVDPLGSWDQPLELGPEGVKRLQEQDGVA